MMAGARARVGRGQCVLGYRSLFPVARGCALHRPFPPRPAGLHAIAPSTPGRQSTGQCSPATCYARAPARKADEPCLYPPGACSLPFAVRSAMPTDTMECELTSGRHGQCPNRTLTLGEESEIPSAERICVCSSVRSQDARAHTRNQSGSMMNERFRAAVNVRCSRLLKIIQQNEQFYGYPVSSTRRRTMYIISTL